MSGRLWDHGVLFLIFADTKICIFCADGIFAGCFCMHCRLSARASAPQLLYRIAAAEKATPMPLFAEMVMVILILEVSGKRSPDAADLGPLC